MYAEERERHREIAYAMYAELFEWFGLICGMGGKASPPHALPPYYSSSSTPSHALSLACSLLAGGKTDSERSCFYDWSSTSHYKKKH